MSQELQAGPSGIQKMGNLVHQGKDALPVSGQEVVTRLQNAARANIPGSGSTSGFGGSSNPYYRRTFENPKLFEYLRQASRKFELLSRLKPIDMTVNYTGNILQNYRNAIAGGMGFASAAYAAANEASMIWVANAGVAATAAMYTGAATLGAGIGLGAVAGLENIQIALLGESYTSKLIAGGIRLVAGEPSQSFMDSWDHFDKNYLWWLP